MATQPAVPQTINDFLTALAKFPELLVKFLDIAKEWYKLQQNPQLPPVTSGGGPQHFEIGGTNALQTTDITDEFLESIAKDYATAEVKEKAIMFIRGFVMGVMMAGGGA